MIPSHHAIQVTVQIGKQGITPTLITEIKNQLKTRKIIKIKLLQSALENKTKKELAKELAHLTSAELIHQVGFVVVLARRGYNS